MEQTLSRECREELGIDIRNPQFLKAIDDPEFRMSIFVITEWDGVVRNAAPEEHAEISWLSSDALEHMAFVDSRLPHLLTDVLLGQRA